VRRLRAVPMVVRTWNLFHGNTLPPGRRAYLREMVELITADRPAIVCLQEIPLWALRHLQSWSGMQAISAVARQPRVGNARLGGWITELNHGLLRSALTGEADAILAAPQFTVSHERELMVSTNGIRRLMHGLRLDGGVFVANFHTTGDDQFRKVADLVQSQAGEEAVVAGDANLRPGEGATYGLLRKRGFSEPLPGSIDQILVRGLPSSPPVAWPEERRRAHGRLLSDHAPVELTVG
jgi:endonuclease/exonuclease/phosphatase family metal-dependent hydrolase